MLFADTTIIIYPLEREHFQNFPNDLFDQLNKWFKGNKLTLTIEKCIFHESDTSTKESFQI